MKPFFEKESFPKRRLCERTDIVYNMSMFLWYRRYYA